MALNCLIMSRNNNKTRNGKNINFILWKQFSITENSKFSALSQNFLWSTWYSRLIFISAIPSFKKSEEKNDLMFISNVNVTFNYIDKKLYLILCLILKILIWVIVIRKNSMFFQLPYRVHLIKAQFSKSCPVLLIPHPLGNRGKFLSLWRMVNSMFREKRVLQYLQTNE